MGVWGWKYESVSTGVKGCDKCQSPGWIARLLKVLLVQTVIFRLSEISFYVPINGVWRKWDNCTTCVLDLSSYSLCCCLSYLSQMWPQNVAFLSLLAAVPTQGPCSSLWTQAPGWLLSRGGLELQCLPSPQMLLKYHQMGIGPNQSQWESGPSQGAALPPVTLWPPARLTPNVAGEGYSSKVLCVLQISVSHWHPPQTTLVLPAPGEVCLLFPALCLACCSHCSETVSSSWGSETSCLNVSWARRSHRNGYFAPNERGAAGDYIGCSSADITHFK